MKKIFFIVCIVIIYSNAVNAQATKGISLEEILQLGLEMNPDILRAKQEINSARGRTLQAGRIPNPEVGFTYNEIPSRVKFGSANEKDFGLSQSFEYPSKRSNRISVAEVDEQIAATTVEQITARVLSDIKKSYVNAQSAQVIVRSIETQIGLFQDFQHTVANKYKTGESKYLDVLRIEIEVARLHNELIEAKNNYSSSLTELKNNIGDSTSVLYEPIDSLVYTPMSADRDSLVNLYLNKSNSIQITRLQIAKQENVLSLAQTSYYPDFGVGLAYQQRTPSSSFLGVEMKVSVPLWFWQEPRGQVEEASAQLNIAQLQQRSVERRIRNNLNTAYASVQFTEQRVKNYVQVLQKGLYDMLNAALTQYRNNQIDLLNLFDIYRTYRQTQTEYIRSIANYQHALVEFEVAAEIFSE